VTLLDVDLRERERERERETAINLRIGRRFDNLKRDIDL